jgi:dolichol-phosphate mannosyltransferase
VSDLSPAPSDSASKVLIAICTFQESENIVAMLDGLRAGFPAADLLVVDDNSPDGTADIVRRHQQRDARVELKMRVDQRGLGSAIVTAMRHAVSGGYEYFLNLDADLSHDPAALPTLLAKAQADRSLDVVIGSRYVAGGQIVGWPLRRRMMSKMVNRFATRFLGLPVNDCSGSMRCYRVSTLESIGLDSLRCTGYAVLEEVLVRIHRAGGQMAEVPICFTEREHGRSKLTLREAIRSLGFMIRLAFELRQSRAKPPVRADQSR